MSVEHYIRIATKEQFAKQHDREKLLNGEVTDFANIVHADYKVDWISPRSWFFEDFLELKLNWGEGRLIPKQAWLEALPKAREWVKDPANEIDEEDVAYVLEKYNELERLLGDFNEETHVLITTKC